MGFSSAGYTPWTEACKDGKNCKRNVCFFSYSARQLRTPPESSSAAEEVRKSPNLKSCCAYCHSVTASPTSTLMAVLRVSPPMSPVCSPGAAAGYCNYKQAILAELIANLEAMNLNLNQETILSQAACYEPKPKPHANGSWPKSHNHSPSFHMCEKSTPSP